MKYCFNIILLIGLTTILKAQNGPITWGPEYDDRGYYSIIGEASGALFVEHKYNSRLNSRDVDLELIRFDQNMEISHAVELRNLEAGSYESVATINSPEGLAHIYYQTYKSGDHVVSAQLFDHETLQKTEIVDLAKFEIIKNAERTIQQDGNFQYIYPLDIILSRDKTKLAIMFDQEKAGKKKRYYHQYCVIDLANRFSIVQQGNFFSDEQSNKYSISDRHLSNSGKLTYAIKRYVKNTGVEHINKQPAYDYEIHHMPGNTEEEYIYDIKVRKEFMDRLVIGSDNDDNLYIAGYYRNQPFGDITKTFLLGLDALGYERFQNKDPLSKRDIKTIIGKEKKRLDNNFETIDIFPTEDIVYLVRQYRRRGSRNDNLNNGFVGNRWNRVNQFNNIVYHWNYDEVVVEGIGPQTGEVQWIKVNPREHEDDNYHSRYFITGQMEVIGNTLYMVYNEREENIIKIRRKDDIKRTDIPGDQTVITMVSVGPEGVMNYSSVGREDHFHLPEQGFLAGENDLFFFYHHRNYRKFYAGKSSKELLNF